MLGSVRSITNYRNRIPFERAVDLANQFSVSHLLAPLFDYTAPPPPISLSTAGPSNFNQHYAPPGTPSLHSYNSNETLDNRKRSGSLLPPNQMMNDDYKRIKVDSITALGNGSNRDFSLKLKRSTKTSSPVQESNGVPSEESMKVERHKTILKSIFATDPSNSHNIPDLSTTFPPDINVDTSIDDHDHSALHWAAALARIPVVQALINFGADMNRGNNVGETPLIRAVLVTNNSDNDSFMRILEILGPSLRTVDDTGRTVLHHAVLVAGVKGRASSARYYVESILEYVARHEKGQFSELVDAEDSHGDTALNIAARVGNRGLVRMLIEVGADKVKPNKLGLRPGDFGVDGVVCYSLFVSKEDTDEIE